jgi:small GTP-binding protein
MASLDATAAAKSAQSVRRSNLAAGAAAADDVGTARCQRTVAVVGAAGHGKSALVNAVMGDSRATDGRATLRSVLSVDESRADGLRLTLADTPGHPDLRGDAESLLHLCDGALLAVDCIEGVLSTTESLVRAAWAAGTRSVLVLTKLDRILQTEASFDEVVYGCLAAAVSQAKAIAAAADDDGGRRRRSAASQFPMDACVFACGRDGWGFTLHSFAKIYAERFGVDATKLVGRLWGNSFYDAHSRRWVSRADERLVREKKDFRTIWSGWLLRENTVEMRWQRYYHVLEKDNLSWYTQPNHYGKLDPGPRGMFTMDDYELDGTHQLLAEIEQPHTFALLPAGYREREAANVGEQHEGSQPLVLAAENEATLEAFKEKWARNLEFLRRRKLRLAGEFDDQLPRRAFCQFVLEPLRGVCAAALREQRPRLVTRLKNLGARELTKAELELRSVDLMNAALRAWLPLDRAVASTVRANVPSAEVQAGVHRSAAAAGPDTCHLLLNQMIPVPAGISLPDGGRFMALGRVFGGALKVGSSLGYPRVAEQRPVSEEARVHLTGMWQWSGGSTKPEKVQAVEGAEEGDVVMVSLASVDRASGQGAMDSLTPCPARLRDCSIAKEEDEERLLQVDQPAPPAAVVWVDVVAAEGQDFSKLLALVHRAVSLTSSGLVYRPIEPVDKRVHISNTADGSGGRNGIAVGACGELLLHIWITQFQTNCTEEDFEASVGEAYVPVRESVSAAGKLVVSTSPDRTHWLTMSAAPISPARCAALRKAQAAVAAAAVSSAAASRTGDAGGNAGSADDADNTAVPEMDAGRQLDEALAHACGSDVDTKTSDQRILLDGPGPGINILEDKRVGATAEQASEFAHMLQTSEALLRGLLCSETLDGVRLTLYQYQSIHDLELEDFNGRDVAPVSEPAAASGGAAGSDDGDKEKQLHLAIERVVRAACISAAPCLLEPLYDVEVVCGSEDDVVGVYHALSERGGTISGERQHPTSPTYFVTGCVPVARSFGLTAAMGVETAGSAAVQCSFRGGWQRVVRPVAETLPAAFTRYIEAARLRQGVDVAVALPSLASLTDKMSSEESADAVTAHQDTAASAPAAAASWEQVEAAGDEFEPEPEPEPEAKGGGKRGKQIIFSRPDSKNVDREPEARAW